MIAGKKRRERTLRERGVRVGKKRGERTLRESEREKILSDT